MSNITNEHKSLIINACSAATEVMLGICGRDCRANEVLRYLSVAICAAETWNAHEMHAKNVLKENFSQKRLYDFIEALDDDESQHGGSCFWALDAAHKSALSMIEASNRSQHIRELKISDLKRVENS